MSKARTTVIAIIAAVPLFLAAFLAPADAFAQDTNLPVEIPLQMMQFPPVQEMTFPPVQTLHSVPVHGLSAPSEGSSVSGGNDHSHPNNESTPR